MLVKIKNTYHNTEEFAVGDNIEDIKQSYIESIKWTANNLAENEVESDWKLYFKTYDDAFNATYDGILEQLISEVKFEVITKNLTILELIDKLSELSEDEQKLPIYVTNDIGDNFEVTSVSLYDENDAHSLENPLGLNFNVE